MQKGMVLKYVIEKTQEIFLAAINQDSWMLKRALQYIKKQTPEICIPPKPTTLVRTGFQRVEGEDSTDKTGC